VISLEPTIENRSCIMLVIVAVFLLFTLCKSIHKYNTLIHMLLIKLFIGSAIKICAHANAKHPLYSVVPTMVMFIYTHNVTINAM